MPSACAQVGVATRIHLNSDGSRLAAIDAAGTLTLYDASSAAAVKEETSGGGQARIEVRHAADEAAKPAGTAAKLDKADKPKASSGGSKGKFEQKHVVQFMWSHDSPEMFVLMRRTEFVVFRALQARALPPSPSLHPSSRQSPHDLPSLLHHPGPPSSSTLLLPPPHPPLRAAGG